MAGEQDDEITSRPLFAFDPDTAVEAFHRFFAKCQTKAGAATTPHWSIAHLDIALEDFTQVIWWDSAAVITDSNAHETVKFWKSGRKGGIDRDPDVAFFFYSFSKIKPKKLLILVTTSL